MKFPIALLPLVWTCKDEHPWRWLSENSHFHLDNGVAMSDFRFAEGLIKSLAEFSPCPVGEVVMYLLALPAIDYQYGRETSSAFFRHAKQLRDQLQFPIESELEWHVPDVDRHINFLDRLFFAESKPKSETETETCLGLKFYVYEDYPNNPDARTPIDENDSKYLAFFGERQLPINCAFGMYGTEIVFPSLIRREYQACVTRDKEEADFFIVPSFFKCLDQLNWIDKFAQEGAVGTKLLNETLEFLGEQQVWTRNRGRDHLFLFSWGLFPCNLSGFNDGRLMDAIFLQVENICTRENQIPKLASYNSWKDVMIPGLIDKWRIELIRKHSRSPEERDILLSFHGRNYGPGTVRDLFVTDLNNLPSTSFGGFIEDYHETIGRSWFCLVPRGVTAWTVHLYVALFAGCVPVIVSDDLVFPFHPDIVNFDDFIVRWPEHLPPFDLYAYLTNMPEQEYIRRQSLASRASCWFDYFSEDSDCSAMLGIFRGLKKKRLMRDILER